MVSSLAIDVGIAAGDDAPGLQQVHAVGDLHGEVGVLLDQQHGDAPPGVEVGDDLEQLLGDQRRETEAGLVAQQQLRTAHQGAGDRQHLLLPT